jgi:hypothetical protein
MLSLLAAFAERHLGETVGAAEGRPALALPRRLVWDAYVDLDSRVHLIDVAPFHQATDPLLFDWAELGTLAEVAEDAGVDVALEPELRLVPPDGGGVAPSAQLYYGLPHELQMGNGTNVADLIAAAEYAMPASVSLPPELLCGNQTLANATCLRVAAPAAAGNRVTLGPSQRLRGHRPAAARPRWLRATLASAQGAAPGTNSAAPPAAACRPTLARSAAGQRQVFDVGAQRPADAGAHRVVAFVGVLQRGVAQAVDDVGVIAQTAHQGVGAGATVEQVVDMYRYVASAFQKSKASAALLLTVERKSREVLVMWLAYCFCFKVSLH